MALANGGTVQREHTCLVDSTSSCPGLDEINRRSWRLGLPPSANLLLYGPSFMNEIVSSILAPNAEELTPNLTYHNVQEQRLGQAATASWSGCNVPGGGDATCRLRGACRDGACTYAFRNGARLTAVTNAEELQDPGSQTSRDAFAELLRANSFSHVYFMMPHGQEYWVESAAARRRSRRNEPAKIIDSLGRNMCLPSAAGAVATWGEYSTCVSESVYWQAAHRLVKSDRLTLVVPWMQAVPDGARAFGQPVVSTFEEASAHGCEMTHDGIGEGEPSEGPLGRVIHQCVVVCEQGDALKAALEQRKPDGPCSGGSVALVAQKLVSVLRSSQR